MARERSFSIICLLFLFNPFNLFALCRFKVSNSNMTAAQSPIKLKV